MQQPYRKHFIPLESTPEIFNQLSASLGARPCLEFQDVLTLDEPNLFPHPAIALILVFQPERAEDDVDYHYICLVRSPKNGHLYELDGDRKGPIDRGDVLLREEDLLGQGALQVVREYFENGEDGIGFSLMALVAKEDAADHCVEQHLHLDPNRVHSEDSGRKPPT